MKRYDFDLPACLAVLRHRIDIHRAVAHAHEIDGFGTRADLAWYRALRLESASTLLLARYGGAHALIEIARESIAKHTRQIHETRAALEIS